jgi:hypothetical protein
MARRRGILYPSGGAPVFQALPEALVDRWYQPWLPPVRRPRAALIAAALAASGLTFTALPPEVVTLDKWFAQQPDPVRRPVRALRAPAILSATGGFFVPIVDLGQIVETLSALETITATVVVPPSPAATSSGYRGLEPPPRANPANVPQVVGLTAQWLNGVRDVTNNMLQGKVNVTLDVTLTANSATTTISDPRIGGGSAILLCPMTANAAAELAAGGIYVSSIGKQTATLTHANAATTDRTFRIVIIG